MLEERFSFNGVSGTVRRLPKLRAEIGAAQYIAAIMRARGIVFNTDDVYVTRVYLAASDFAKVAVRLQDVTGLPFAFPHSSAADEAISAAFEWYVDHSEDEMWAQLQAIMEQLDLPNGKAGSPAEALAPVDLADPLLSTPVPTLSNGSAKS